jgi:hypothetical protein
VKKGAFSNLEVRMQDPERKSQKTGIIAVLLIAAAATVPGYFATQIMDVSGRSNSVTGISAAILAAIFCVSVLAGVGLLLAGRHKPRGNVRIALVATVVVSVFLLLVAFAAGTSSTEPASTTHEGG